MSMLYLDVKLHKNTARLFAMLQIWPAADDAQNSIQSKGDNSDSYQTHFFNKLNKNYPSLIKILSGPSFRCLELFVGKFQSICALNFDIIKKCVFSPILGYSFQAQFYKDTNKMKKCSNLMEILSEATFKCLQLSVGKVS